MREIKFRAYLKADNKIYNVLSFFSKFLDEEYNRVFLDRSIINWEVTNYQVDWENVILMQFSWLKDSSWNDIYEWDIVYIAWTWLVEIKFPFYELYENIYNWTSWDIEDIRGNIYENPELIRP